MAAKPDNEHRIAEAAYLESLGSSRKEIAKQFGVTEGTVSRWIDEAVERKWLVLRSDFDPTKLPETVRTTFLQEHGCQRLQKELMDALKRHGLSGTLKRVLVTRAMGPDEEHHRKAIAARAARRLVELFSDHNVRLCGIPWGRTILETLESLTALRPDVRSGLTFVAVCGEPVFSGADHPGLSASRLAREFANTLTGSSRNCLTLIGTPSSIPHSFGKQIETVRRFVQSFRSHQQVFVETIGKLDMLITSAGSATETPWPWQTDRAAFDELTNWSQFVLGDISGWAFPRPVKDRQEKKKADEVVAEVNSRWMGINLDHLRQIARKKPGVILIAATRAKATIVLEAIRHECVTEALICDQLCEQMIELLRDAQ